MSILPLLIPLMVGLVVCEAVRAVVPKSARRGAGISGRECAGGAAGTARREGLAVQLFQLAFAGAAGKRFLDYRSPA